jgi:hypothetical protein
MEVGSDMDWKTLLAYVTGSGDQELLLRNEYLVTENRLLKPDLVSGTAGRATQVLPPRGGISQWP